MATTINSGYASSPKLTANIADHADVYGGRALVFDGIADYLTLGNSSIFNHSGNYSISVWIKKIGQPNANVDTNVNPTIIAKGNVYFTLFVNYDGMLGTFFYNNSNATDYNIKTADGVIKLNVWHHVVLTWNNSSSQLYVDGKQEYSGSYTPYNLNTGVNGTEIRIGESPTSDTRWHGNMCDMKIFDSHLTEAQVQELYKKPENTPSAVQDNLVAWYPMIEGNPESPQSIVYDHSENKLGSELFGDPSFELSGDNADSEDTAYFSNVPDGVQITGGQMIVTGTGTKIPRPVPNPQVTAGKTYKIVTNVASYSGGAIRFNNNNSTISTGNFTPSNIGDNVHYFTASLTGSLSRMTISYAGGQPIFTLNSISIKEVQMGNHATTNFFGDELITYPSFDTVTEHATNNNSWIDDTLDSSQEAELTQNTSSGNARTGNNSGAVAMEATTCYLSYRKTDLTAGKTYYSEIYIKSGTGSGTGRMIIGTASRGEQVSPSEAPAVDFNTSGWSKIYATWVASQAEQFITIIFTNVANAETHYIDDFSLKEVGISSSGFETAVNEPVVPQVPLMRYNQKMLFDNTDDYIDLPSPILTTIHSISFWVHTNDSSSLLMPFSEEDGHTDGVHIYLLNNQINYRVNSVIKTESYTYQNKLTHFCCTYDGSTMNIYANGVVLGSGASNSTTLSVTTAGNIGARGYAPNYFFNGIIDDFSIFSSALTQTQVQELFNDGVALDATTHSKASALKAYWRNDGVTTWKNRGDKFASFDGVDDVITRNAINVDYKSVSVWLRPSTTITSASSGSVLMFFGNWSFGSVGLGSQTGDFTNELITLTDYDGVIKKTAWIPSGGETIPNDSWTHLAFVWDGSKYVIYYNGQPQTVVASSSGHIPLNTNKNIRIGTGGASSTSFFGGDITGVAFWSESLTDAQVLNIYNSGHNGNIASIQSSNLELYYTFNPHALTDADTNASVQDRSGNDNDSTSVSGAVINRDGDVQGSPDSITIREGLNSNRDGLGFYFTNPSSNVLRLNGESEYLHIENDLLAEKPTGTISFWAKTSGTSTQAILGYHRSQWSIRLNKTTVFMGIGGIEVTASSSLDNSGWGYHAITFDQGTAKFYKLNLDTPLYHTSTDYLSNNVKTFPSNTNGIFVGKRNHANSNFYGGLVDEIKIYDRVLTLDELTKNYKHQKGKHKND